MQGPGSGSADGQSEGGGQVCWLPSLPASIFEVLVNVQVHQQELFPVTQYCDHSVA